mgnify:CR=1 FL=1
MVAVSLKKKDIVNPKLKYNSFYQNELNRENSILCLSASKAFNLAGLQGAAIVCDNQFLKNRIERGFNNDEIAEPNFFVIEAYKCAFNNGDEYLKQFPAEFKKGYNKYLKDAANMRWQELDPRYSTGILLNDAAMPTLFYLYGGILDYEK